MRVPCSHATYAHLSVLSILKEGLLHDATYLALGPSPVPVQEEKGIISVPNKPNVAPKASRPSWVILQAAASKLLPQLGPRRQLQT